MHPWLTGALSAWLATLPVFTSVETFLGALPPDLRRHHVLMHASRSLQGASRENPRALTVSLDGTFAYAFTADGNTRGRTVEMWRFDPATRRYEFRELDFTDGTGRLSPPNPPLCLGCHGRDPRPIWGAYPVWEGAFGGYRPGGKNADPPELQRATEAFYRRQPDHPRYGKIVVEPVKNQTTRNVAFMQILYDTNHRRVGRLMAATPYYDEYKFAILGAQLCLARPEVFLPRFLPFPLAALHWTRFTARMRRDHAIGAFQNLDYLFEPRGLSTAEWSTLLGPLDERVGSRYATGEREDLDADSAGRAAYWFVQGDAELQAYLGRRYETSHGITSLPATRKFPYLVAGTSELCDALAAESRRRLAELLRLTPAEIVFRESARGAPPATAIETLARCNACHGKPEFPRLPFGDARELAAALSTDASLLDRIADRTRADRGQGQMPPEGALSDDERTALLEFLRALRE